MWKLFLNPTVLLALVAFTGVSSSFAYWRGGVNKENALQAKYLAEDLVREKSYQAAMAALAAELADKTTKQITITRPLEKEVRIEPVYINCRHSTDAWRLLLDAHRAAGLAEPVSGGELPAQNRAAE
jgi:hypothetical protein